MVHGALQEVAPSVVPELDDNVGVLSDVPGSLLDGPDERESLPGSHAFMQAYRYYLLSPHLDPIDGGICLGAHIQDVVLEVSPGRQFGGILDPTKPEWGVLWEHSMAYRLAYYIVGLPAQIPARLVWDPFYRVDRRVQTPGLGPRLPLYHDAQSGI